MIDAPTVSVIIPFYNQGEYLHAAVQSALMSYAGPLDVIIVNDGSVEPGADTYLRNARKLSPAVRVVEQANGGLSSARNTGLEHSIGTFIQFLDADDALFPSKIDRQLEHFKARPNLLGSVTQYALCDEWMLKFDVDYDSIGRFALDIRSFLYLWERGFSVPIHCGLFRRAIFDELRFDTNVYGKEDWIFWCSILRNRADGLGYLPVLGAVYRIHAAGMTRSYHKMGQSFAAAARRIDAIWGHEYSDFAIASATWFEEFYRPRTETEEMLRPTAPTAAAGPAHDDRAPIFPQAPPLGHSDGRLGPVVTSSTSAPERLAIVIPVYNHVEYLDTCLRSVTAQTGIERIVIVDDASPDPRVTPLLRSWADADARITHLRNAHNLGISETQNRGVDAIGAEFVGFVDCDDFLEPDAAATVLQWMAQTPADYYFSDRADVDDRGDRTRIARYGGYGWIAPGGNVADDLLLGMVASHWKVIRRSLYQDLGGCREKVSGVQDWDLALRAAPRACFCYIPEVLYNHRIHARSVSGSHRTAQLWLTNVVRREAVERYSVMGASDETVTELLGGDDLKAYAAKVRTGHRLVFDDLGRDLTAPEIEILREYNSLFDSISVGETSAVALSGHLWKHSVLI
jgi:glycosyltransferase involved in cell wall biosynthesis